jgi:Ser/Thr protein kinase RdoA (MazF antagonist)
MDDSYSRVGSTLPLPTVIQQIVHIYALGDVTSIAAIPGGYQDYVVDVTTNQGRFIVKIFSKEKPTERIHDILWAHAAFTKADLPCVMPLHTTEKQSYIQIQDGNGALSASVFPFIAGKTLTRTPVTDTDLEVLTKTLITIHNTPHILHQYYNPLGIMNLPAEFAGKQQALTPDEVSLISPIIAKLHKLKLSSLPQSIIHGSMEKDNVIKDTTGTMHVLDFGSVDYNASVLDIATYVANFTLYVDPVRRIQIIHHILDTYQTSRTLTPPELSALLTLIRSQYAAYVVGMTYRMRKEHDMTKYTQTWLDRGWDGLRAYAGVKRIL